MDNEMKEIVMEPEDKPVNTFDHVTITAKEYRKLISKIERYKVEREFAEQIESIKTDAENYRRWWCRCEDENKKLKEALEDAKRQLKELLGVEDASDEQK